MDQGDTITYRHSREAMLAHVQRSLKKPARKPMASIYAIVVGVCLVGLSWPDKVAAALAAAVFIVALPVYLEFLWFPRQLKASYEKMVDGNPSLLTQRQVRFDENGVEVSVESSTTRTLWNAFEGYQEDETNFYLKQRGRQLPGMIPKSAFRPDQLDRFARLLKQIPREPPKLGIGGGPA